MAYSDQPVVAVTSVPGGNVVDLDSTISAMAAVEAIVSPSLTGLVYKRSGSVLGSIHLRGAGSLERYCTLRRTWFSCRGGRVVVRSLNVASGSVSLGSSVGFFARTQWRVVLCVIVSEECEGCLMGREMSL